MRTLAIVLLSAGILSLAGAHATTTPGDIANVAPIATTETGVIRLAGSFHNSNAKLGDRSLGGYAGGFYGIGGSEPKVKSFKDRMKKIPRCCANSQ
jgi:hypothetical protein